MHFAAKPAWGVRSGLFRLQSTLLRVLLGFGGGGESSGGGGALVLSLVSCDEDGKHFGDALDCLFNVAILVAISSAQLHL